VHHTIDIAPGHAEAVFQHLHIFFLVDADVRELQDSTELRPARGLKLGMAIALAAWAFRSFENPALEAGPDGLA